MSSVIREGTIGSILYNSQIITEKDIETALAEQTKTGLRFGEALVALGIVQQEDIDWALSHQLDIPYVRIRKETVDPAVLSLVPAVVARKHNLLPIIRIGDELRIAIADPLNKEALAEVAKVSGCTIEVSMGLLREIREMQDYYYGDAAKVQSLGFSSQSFSDAVLEAINSDISGARLLEYLLLYLVQKNLSSISLRPLESNVTITGKSGASSRGIGTLSREHYDGLLATIQEKVGFPGSGGRSFHGSLNFAVKGEQAQFQVILLQAGRWECLTLKPMIKSMLPENIAAIGTSERNREMLRALATLSEGMVLFSSMNAEVRARLMGACLQVSGGSGKDVLAVGCGFSFCGDIFPVLPVDRRDGDMNYWLRAVLEHDPAVMAVEEIADVATFTAAFDAALRGKLLFGGVSASGLHPLLKQLMSLRERLPMLAHYLRGIVACRGVRILCPACKEGRTATVPPLPLLTGPLTALYSPAKGCPLCGYTGYAGMRWLVEAALFDEKLTEIFDTSVESGEVMEYLIQNGFQSIAADAEEMLHGGEITVEEYLAITIEGGTRPWPE